MYLPAFFHSGFLTEGVVVLTLPGFFVLSVTFLMASAAGSFFSGSVVSSDEGSVLSSVTASTAAPLSEGAVVSSPFFFDLQPAAEEEHYRAHDERNGGDKFSFHCLFLSFFDFYFFFP